MDPWTPFFIKGHEVPISRVISEDYSVAFSPRGDTGAPPLKAFILIIEEDLRSYEFRCFDLRISVVVVYLSEWEAEFELLQEKVRQGEIVPPAERALMIALAGGGYTYALTTVDLEADSYKYAMVYSVLAAGRAKQEIEGWDAPRWKGIDGEGGEYTARERDVDVD